MTLKEEIMKSKTDSQALVGLIERFAPLLKKHAKMLLTEDAYAELQLKFIETIVRFCPDKMHSQADPYILSYLSHCIYNHYIFLSKQERLNKSVYPISSFGDEDNDNGNLLDKLCSPIIEHYKYEDFDFLYKNLTEYEADILIAVYYYHYKIQEIALHYRVSPSAVSQAKSNAIKKLKKALSKGGQVVEPV